DTSGYLKWAEQVRPGPARPWGYSGFLWLLLHGLGHREIVALQHVLVLVVAAALYAFLVRRGVVAWLAALGVVPLTMSPILVNIEHHLLSDPLFIALIVGSILLVAWSRDRPAVWACALAGLFLAYAGLTRQVGLAAVPLVLLYLVIRRASILAIASFALAVTLPLVGYLFWMKQEYDVYAFTVFGGKHLYARVAPIAQCDRLPDLSAQERRLCDSRPLDERPGPEGYLWTGGEGPVYEVPNRVQRSFARKVIRHQPLDYVAMVARQTGHVFYPGQRQREGEPCVAYWAYPDPLPSGCRTDAVGTSIWKNHPFEVNRPLAHGLAQYAKLDYLIGPAFLVSVLLTLFALVWRPRDGGWRMRLDAALLGAVGFGLVLAAIATANFSYRYSMPLYATLPPAAVLAITHLLWLRRRRAEPREETR
ncbi:MAG: hypothetical protein KY396_03330, partial [Actinobacteria bacterium]|nr:hypothetical protein [Actinomycetota bacterium]